MKLFDVYPLYNISPVRAKDVYVYDESGQEYLDLYGGHAVISIGHAHPHYVKKISTQLDKIGFYSNAVQNPLQQELADKLGKLSGCDNYELFLCNSGAEANENGLKLASFTNGKSQIIAFKNSFHGRTSAAVSVTDNPKISAPLNAQHQVTFLPLNDVNALENELSKNLYSSVIVEPIQGVGGLDEGTNEFFKAVEKLCKKYNTLLILDEVQSGYGRSGKFFGFQHHHIIPDIITMAKGMGNGFPMGGILVHPQIKASHGMLGTTFGGNHLACAAGIAVLDVIENEQLLTHVQEVSEYFFTKAHSIPGLKKVKGRGLMLGLEFDFEIASLRKKLLDQKHIFTGNSNNKNLIRILPPLTIQKHHFDVFFEGLLEILNTQD